ncbi:substrate-binding domain-containing protein [Rhodobacterales bacterium]|nr:substrate-binding domain-containing protein [Rhodobacterales bacterium]
MVEMIVRFFCFICLWLTSALAVAADFRVTFINPGYDRGFWGDVSRTMEAAAKDLSADVEVLYAEWRPYGMEELLQSRLKRGDPPDYFIFVNSEKSSARMMQLLDGAPSKVLFLLDNLSPQQRLGLEKRHIGLGNIVASVVPDDETAGYETARALISEAREHLPERSGFRMLSLTGRASSDASREREVGMLRAVLENPDLELLHSLPANWMQEQAYLRTREILQRSRIDLVWSANDGMSFGAQRAVREAGLEPGRDVLFTGVDWSSEAMAAVRDGSMTMTYGGHFFAGAWAIVILRDHFFREAMGEVYVDVRFKMSPITADNVDLYIERLGDRDWERIDFKAFCKSVDRPGGYDFSSETLLEAVEAR